jgi:hypothetical protein
MIIRKASAVNPSVKIIAAKTITEDTTLKIATIISGR